MPEGNSPKDEPPPTPAPPSQGWIKGKDEDQLLLELKAYLARLRRDPRNLSDRLRVAAIQLRLGRVDEAMVHYRGVIGGYIREGQLLSAAALSQKLLKLFPGEPSVLSYLEQINARLSQVDLLADAEPTEEITEELSSPPLQLQSIEELETLRSVREREDLPEPLTAGSEPSVEVLREDPDAEEGGSLASLEESDFLDALTGDDDPWLEETGTNRAAVERLPGGAPGSWRSAGREDDTEAGAKTARYRIKPRPIVLDHVKAMPVLPKDLAMEGEIEVEDTSQSEDQEGVLLLTKKKPRRGDLH